jgi:hypothetical protein
MADTVAQIIGTVHDEIILGVSEGMADDAAEILRKTMIDAGKTYLSKVPLKWRLPLERHGQRSRKSKPQVHDGAGCEMLSVQFDLRRFTPQVSDLIASGCRLLPFLGKFTYKIIIRYAPVRSIAHGSSRECRTGGPTVINPARMPITPSLLGVQKRPPLLLPREIDNCSYVIRFLSRMLLL